MSEDWGLISGIIGGLAGIIGGGAGVYGALQVNKLKKHDKRIDNGKTKNRIKVNLKEIEDLIYFADRSRKLRLAAQGKSQSGEMRKWEIKYKDTNHLYKNLLSKYNELKDEKPIRLDEQGDLSIALNEIEEELNSIKHDLTASIKEDDKAREQLAKMRETYKR